MKLVASIVVSAVAVAAACVLIAAPASAETDAERANALVAQAPSANGAFYAQQDLVLHLPSGMLCEVKGDFDRRLQGLSVEQDPDWGEVATCHYKVRVDADNDGKKKLNDRISLTFSVVRATPQDTADLRQRARDIFLKRNPNWRFARKFFEFKGKVQFGDESYVPSSDYFVASEGGTKLETYYHVGVVRDWITRVQVTGPENLIGTQSIFLSTYWTNLANRVIALGELRKRQNIPTSAAPGQLENMALQVR